MQQYFKKTGQNLFCQDFLINSALQHTNTFLKELDKHFNFEEMWNDKLLKVYKGKATLGRPAYKPSLVLKMLFLSYLFNTSERDIERIVNDSISMKAFLNLSLDEAAPDHSTLTKFKDRFLNYREIKKYYNDYSETDIFKELFDEIIIKAQEENINLGFSQAIDSTHTIADVNTKKDKQRQKKEIDEGENKEPRDPDAKWGVKRSHQIKTVEGNKVKVNESYFGYKSHLSVNTDSNLITSFSVTSMNTYDGHEFEPLMKDDIQKGVAQEQKTTYTADRAYDDGELHAWLDAFKFKDAIFLKYIEKEDLNDNKKPNAKFTKNTTQEEFENGLNQRYVVERVNASLKKWHGLSRARYLGLEKMKIQTALTSMAHNLKTLVKILSGIGLRTPIPVLNVS